MRRPSHPYANHLRTQLFSRGFSHIPGLGRNARPPRARAAFDHDSAMTGREAPDPRGRRTCKSAHSGDRARTERASTAGACVTAPRFAPAQRMCCFARCSGPENRFYATAISRRANRAPDVQNMPFQAAGASPGSSCTLYVQDMPGPPSAAPGGRFCTSGTQIICVREATPCIVGAPAGASGQCRPALSAQRRIHFIRARAAAPR